MPYTVHLLRHIRFAIGRNIHNERLKQQIPLRKLSRLTGIDHERLDQFELGKNAIRLDELVRIASALDVPFEQINCADLASFQKKSGVTDR